MEKLERQAKRQGRHVKRQGRQAMRPEHQAMRPEHQEPQAANQEQKAERGKTTRCSCTQEQRPQTSCQARKAE